MSLNSTTVASHAAIPSWRSEATSPELKPAATLPSTPSSSSASSRMSGWRQADESGSGVKAFCRRGALRRPNGGSPGTAGALSTSAKSTAPTSVPLASLVQTPKTKAVHYERREMPTDRKSLDRLREDALLASYPYHRNKKELPTGWERAKDAAATVRQEMGLGNAGVEADSGAIIDRRSGLAAVLLLNRSTRELVLSFGGTTAGKKTGATLAERSRPGRNFKSMLSQWGANIFAGFGGTPKSYRQAADLLAAVQRRLATNPALADHTVRVVGHSKGGGEAMYAALKASTPVPVTAFCPAHLSDGLIKQLPAANLARAKDLVRSFSPTGDLVAGMRGLLPGMHGLGLGHHFEGIPGSGHTNLHDQFHKHVLHHCKGISDLSTADGDHRA